jgi:hypothetical protein
MALATAELLYSLGTWAAELGVSRDVFRRVLSEAGIQPAGKKSGHPVYRGRDVIAAWITHVNGGDERDPDKLPPMERRAHYQAEHEKLRLQVERGELVPAIEVEQGHGQIFAIVTQAFDTLPDVLERDAGLSPLQLARVEKHLDELREALYQRLADDETDDAVSTAAN